MTSSALKNKTSLRTHMVSENFNTIAGYSGCGPYILPRTPNICSLISSVRTFNCFGLGILYLGTTSFCALIGWVLHQKWSGTIAKYFVVNFLPISLQVQAPISWPWRPQFGLTRVHTNRHTSLNSPTPTSWDLNLLKKRQIWNYFTGLKALN